MVIELGDGSRDSRSAEYVPLPIQPDVDIASRAGEPLLNLRFGGEGSHRGSIFIQGMSIGIRLTCLTSASSVCGMQIGDWTSRPTSPTSPNAVAPGASNWHGECSTRTAANPVVERIACYRAACAR